MPLEVSENTESDLKILQIPSWLDVDNKGPEQNLFHDFTATINELEGITSGMIYAEMHPQQFSRKYLQLDDLNFPYLGMRAWTPPKRGFLWKTWKSKYFNLFEEFYERYWTPDILHAHSILAGIAAMAISDRTGIPFGITEHISRENIEGLSHTYRKSYSALAARAEYITTVSQQNKEFLEEFLSREVKLIPNFIDTDFFYPKQQVIDTPLFISIGEPAFTKGFDRLIRSFKDIKKQLPKAHLILVEKIRDRKEVIDPLIKKYNLKDSITLPGIVGKEEVRKLLHSSAVYISASRRESFGLTMVEALTCGTPVVATETAGSSDIVNDRVGRMVEQGNVNQLTTAILDVYTHRKEFVPRDLHRYIQENFSVETVLPHWEKLYRDV